MGKGFSSVPAAFAAFKMPHIFGKQPVQSFAFPSGHKEDLWKLIHGSSQDSQVIVEFRANDYEIPFYQATKDGPELRRLLRAKGFKVKGQVTAGAPGFGSWRGQFGTIFRWFAPKDPNWNPYPETKCNLVSPGKGYLLQSQRQSSGLFVPWSSSLFRAISTSILIGQP